VISKQVSTGVYGYFGKLAPVGLGVGVRIRDRVDVSGSAAAQKIKFCSVLYCTNRISEFGLVNTH